MNQDLQIEPLGQILERFQLVEWITGFDVLC